MLLYHATLIDHRPSIMQDGLVPTIGKFVRAVHGKPQPVICLASVERLANTFNALLFHVVDKFIPDAFLNVRSGDVRLDHGEKKFTFMGVDFFEWIARIKDHGMLCEVQSDGCSLHEGGEGHVGGTEPGDYYSTPPLAVSRVLTGEEMWDLYKACGLREEPLLFYQHFDKEYVQRRYA